jgi:hypothetical protein
MLGFRPKGWWFKSTRPDQILLGHDNMEQRDVSLILETGKFELDAARPEVKARWQG